ncbi:MAG: HesB/IscA family protein, partial [Actinomycetes bacterium]
WTGPPSRAGPGSALAQPVWAKVSVVVDAMSKQLLEGATLDYKDGLNQAGFSITNPNASRTCGCGSSFS